MNEIPGFVRKGFDLPDHIKLERVPSEVIAEIEDICGDLFEALARSGNSKAGVAMTIEALLSQVQRTIFEHLESFSAQECNHMNYNLVILTALFRVVMNNPMWDSEALTLQLKTECHNIVKGAAGVELKV